MAGEAKTIQEAIKGIAKWMQDILIFDMAMPGGSGYNFPKCVKQVPSVPLVIVLTNYPAYQHRSLAAGADYALTSRPNLTSSLCC